MATKVLGNLAKGLFFVVSAPAGTGKTTLVRMLTKEFACVVESVSFTTRKPRKNEVEGKDYFFVSEEEFFKKIKNKEFLEYAQVFGHYYGTSREWVLQEQKQGKHVILVIDTQGAKQIKALLPAVFIFLAPPSKGELLDRLNARKTETHESIQQRLSWAEQEIAASKEYNYLIVNDNLTTAYNVLRAILIAEEHRISGQKT